MTETVYLQSDVLYNKGFEIHRGIVDDAGGASLPSVKSDARRRMRSLLKAMPSSLKAELSAAVAAVLSAWDTFQSARCVAAFAADDCEPDLRSIFDRRFIFPRWNGSAYEMAAPDWDGKAPWRRGRFDLLEPTGPVYADSCAEEVLWLVPGVVFAPDGGRIGRGGGFYDRLLARARGIFCGVFFDCQLAEAVPVESHDRFLHFLASESSVRPAAAGRQSLTGRTR